MNNFYPSPQGEIKKRPGTKIIPFRRESLFKRLKRWVRGEPHDIRTMSEFKGVLMVATDRGLYCYNGTEMTRIDVSWDKGKEL